MKVKEIVKMIEEEIEDLNLLVTRQITKMDTLKQVLIGIENKKEEERKDALL